MGYYLRVKKPKQERFEFSDFVTVSGLVLGIMSGFNVFYLLFFSKKIAGLNSLDFDDIITLALGPLATIWLSIQEIYKLFVQPQAQKPPGQIGNP